MTINLLHLDNLDQA